MTPELWRRVDELFDAALEVDPTERERWLVVSCEGDHELLVALRRLLAQDDRAEREGFLPPPETVSYRPNATAPTRVRLRAGHGEDPGCFAPRAAIAAASRPPPTAEPRSLVRARLRELPIINILIVGILLFWTHAVLGDDDPTVFSGDAIAILVLGALIGLLSSPLPISPAGLKAIELGMTAMLAGLVSFIQYRLMLAYSLRDDPMLAQFTMKNIVLIDCILILTYGLYVPKSWRRAAVVVGPLALLPFGTLLVLTLNHPEPLGWLWRGWRKSDTPRIFLFSLDAMILLIVAAGTAFGARTISRLRRQVVEARQLGQYRLRGRIGAGGMGEVYLAEHQLLKRPCALKLIRPGEVSDPKALARFEREVRITATLSHPNTVEIFDYGRTEDGTYYYVMEYLPGLSLEELVKRHGPLPPGRVVYLLRQICQALREAHGAGLIHRDIKPSNIFAAQRGGMDDVGKLLDFGLVRPPIEQRAPHLSDEGHILGTPLFMSPEQAIGGRELDERTDIYSLGAVAYYLLTGRPPFEEGGGIGVLIAHARDPVVPPSQIRAAVPMDLERVVMRCLAKNATDRFHDAGSLDQALGECDCTGDWDQDRAARWWRDAGRDLATQATVT